MRWPLIHHRSPLTSRYRHFPQTRCHRRTQRLQLINFLLLPVHLGIEGIDQIILAGQAYFQVYQSFFCRHGIAFI